ncbi:hypothetical protein JCM6882_005708 [Rhodosporidiobolus microsporus]
MAHKILFVLSSHDKFPSGAPTGWYLPEAAHPYYVVKDAGYEVDFASPKGGKAPLDPSSVDGFKDDEGCRKFLSDSAATKLVENTKKLSDVKQEDYAAIFYVGGHGPLFDLTTDPVSHQLILDFWNAGKVVSLVCHAPCCLIKVKDENGENFVKGKKVTCFSNEEEEIAQKVSECPFLAETDLRAAGAVFVNARKPWEPEVVVDGLLITGANPASAEGVGKEIVKALAALKA